MSEDVRVDASGAAWVQLPERTVQFRDGRAIDGPALVREDPGLVRCDLCGYAQRFETEDISAQLQAVARHKGECDWIVRATEVMERDGVNTIGSGLVKRDCGHFTLGNYHPCHVGECGRKPPTRLDLILGRKPRRNWYIGAEYRPPPKADWASYIVFALVFGPIMIVLLGYLLGWSVPEVEPTNVPLMGNE